jgi:vancomycin resistance protein VanW
MPLPVIPAAAPPPGRVGKDDRWLALKIRLLRARRLALWRARPGDFPSPRLAPGAMRFPHRVAQIAIPIFRADAAADPVLERGKQQNLALAAPSFDGLLIEPARPLSFWRTLGRATAARGYRAGMELSGGCIVPAIGGGLCLLSNALFGMAARLGWDIRERHGHTLQAVPISPGELWGLDATVFWPYVDLRIAPREGPVRLSVAVTETELRLAVDAPRAPVLRATLNEVDAGVATASLGTFRTNRILRELRGANDEVVDRGIIAENRKRVLGAEELARSCRTCGEEECGQHESARMDGLLR